jgi:hypothetical protein
MKTGALARTRNPAIYNCRRFRPLVFLDKDRAFFG